MDISSIFTFVGALVYLGTTIYLANLEQVTGEHGRTVRWLLYSVTILTFLYGLFILQTPFIQAPGLALNVDLTAAVVNFGLTTILCLFSFWIITSPSLRGRIRRLLPASVTYNPESPVHTTAWVLTLALVCVMIGNFVVGGGISGLAQTLESSGVGLGDIVFEDVMWVFAAALGVGLLLRRTPQEALTRLGLRLPTRQDILWGLGVGVLMIGVVFAVSALWSLVVSAQELQQQTAAADQLAASFNSLPLSLLLSVAVAIGEEVFFRGALQPVFGIWLTSLLFAVIHTQYTLTPATLIIFVTSMALGWLRNRYSTSASIMGHFAFNFIQLALQVLAGTSV